MKPQNTANGSHPQPFRDLAYSLLNIHFNVILHRRPI